MDSLQKFLQRYEKYIGFESGEQFTQELKRDTPKLVAKLVVWGFLIAGLWALWTGFAIVYVTIVDWMVYGIPPGTTLDRADSFQIALAFVVIVGAIIAWSRK